MKRASGLIMLLLAALLVAMPAAAVTPGVANGTDVSMLGTKIMMQEEVGGWTAEIMAALAVDPNPAMLQNAPLCTTMMTDSEAINIAAHYYGHDAGLLGSYNSTPGAGGDGVLPRHY